jgi:hypothetical protein
LKRHTVTPATAKTEKLSRQLWEFAEQVRLEKIERQAGA